MTRVLLLAGSEPAGRVGLLRDLAVLARFGLAGRTAAVETAWTAQGPGGATVWQPVSTERLHAQLEAVLSYGAPDVVKVGMLGTADTAHEVARALVSSRPRFMVLDPVLVSSSGATLNAPGLVEAMRSALVPRADLLTPNLDEAGALAGVEVSDQASMLRAGQMLLDMGAGAVLVKGGHLHGPPLDLLVTPGGLETLAGERIEASVRGKGCALSSAVAACVALGMDLRVAVRRARTELEAELRLAADRQVPVRLALLARLQDAADRLAALADPWFVPEVGTNVAEALPGAETTGQVGALTGRIVRCGSRALAMGEPSFGASSHVARVVLAAMEHEPDLRAAANIACSREVLAAARDAGLAAACFDRSAEPAAVAATEGASLPWGVQEALRSGSGRPDIVWDRGGPGREPMIRVLGRDAIDVADKVARIGASLAAGKKEER